MCDLLRKAADRTDFSWNVEHASVALVRKLNVTSLLLSAPTASLLKLCTNPKSVGVITLRFTHHTSNPI